jgi:hypothetical protein
MSENNKSRLRRLQPPWVASHDAAHRAGGGVAMVAIVHDDDSGNIATVDLAREGLLIDKSPFVGRGRCAVVNQQIHQMSGPAADGQEFAYTDMHKLFQRGTARFSVGRAKNFSALSISGRQDCLKCPHLRHGKSAMQGKSSIDRTKLWI